MFSKPFAIAVFCFCALFAAPAAADEIDAEPLSQRFAAADALAPPPDFVFQDAKGQSLRLADFRGRAVVLNLWATWCGPCVEEMPSLDRLQAALGPGKLVVIALDEEREGSPDVTANFFLRHDIKNLGIYADSSGRIGSILHARAMPMSLLIDAEGREIGSVSGGANWDTPDSLAFVKEKLLAGR